MLKKIPMLLLLTYSLVACAAGTGAKFPYEAGYGAVAYKQIPSFTGDIPMRLEIAKFQDVDGGKLAMFDNPYKDRRLDQWKSVYQDENHYRVVLLEPGTYVLRSFTQQEKWGLCFQDETQIIEVKSRSISYLGSIDLSDLIIGLQTAVSKDPNPDLRKASSEIASYYFEDVPEWGFVENSNKDVEAAAAFLERQPTYYRLNVIRADATAGSFSTRKAPLSGRRRCN